MPPYPSSFMQAMLCSRLSDRPHRASRRSSAIKGLVQEYQRDGDVGLRQLRGWWHACCRRGRGEDRLPQLPRASLRRCGGRCGGTPQYYASSNSNHRVHDHTIVVLSSNYTIQKVLVVQFHLSIVHSVLSKAVVFHIHYRSIAAPSLFSAARSTHALTITTTATLLSPTTT